MSMTSIFWALTFCLICGAGVYSGIKVKTQAGWQTGGGQMSWLSVAVIMGAFQIGGVSIIGCAQDGFNMGISGAWYTLIGCLLAGVFEEVGRYLAFRFLLKRYTNRRDAVTYGIGHGGIEAILVLGLTAINNIAIAQLVNSGSIETITNGLTGAQLDQVQAQIAAVASFGAATLLLGLAERAIAMTLHISLSVVVFRAVRQRKAGYLGLAVALHALFDVPAALFQCGVLHSTWLVEALLLVLCLGCAAYAKKQYCALQEPEQQTLSDKEER